MLRNNADDHKEISGKKSSKSGHTNTHSMEKHINPVFLVSKSLSLSQTNINSLILFLFFISHYETAKPVTITVIIIFISCYLMAFGDDFLFVWDGKSEHTHTQKREINVLRWWAFWFHQHFIWFKMTWM